MALRADDVDLGRDRDLVERYQGGDAAAFDDLYRRYFSRLHRFCQRHTSDVHEAEEIAQESFVRALRSMDSLTGERRFYPWMTVIARRLSIDRHRKLSRVEVTDEVEAGSVDGEHDHLFDAVDAGHVRDALAAVGPRHREVLLLREAEGLSYAAIAERLDVPVTTVEALLHRARKALRREYGKVATEDPAGRLWGLPLLGLAATKLGDLRTRVADRWVEAAAVGAPVLAGAITAAVVLGPAPDEQPVETAAPTTVAVVVDEPDAPAPHPGDPLAVPAPTHAPAPAAPTTTEATTPDRPHPAAVDAGPVEVFLGPEGADRAREEAEEMPIRQDVGAAIAGADPPGTGEALVQALEDVGALLLTPPGSVAEPAAPVGHDADARSPLDRLLGGTP